MCLPAGNLRAAPQCYPGVMLQPLAPATLALHVPRARTARAVAASRHEAAAPLDRVAVSRETAATPAVAIADATPGAIACAAGSAVAAGLFQGIKTGFVTGYLDPSAALARARALAAKYPNLCQVVERPYKTDGYDGKRADLRGPAPLYYLRIGRQDAARDHRVGVLQMAAPHAREWIQPMIITELAEELLQNYDPSSTDPAVRANTALVDNLDIYLVPVTNPDGTNYSMYDQDMWRKNRRPLPNGQHGVDINRNYPYKWDNSTRYRSETYSGPAPASEPETRNTTELVDEHPNIRFVCDWHSHGEEVRHPWGIAPQDIPFYERFQNRMADAIATVRGHHYQVTDSMVIHGASDDFFYQDKGLYSSIIEDAQAFHPDHAEAQQVMREGVAGARELLCVAREYQQAAGLARAHPLANKPADPPDMES